jgi:hypothetical protein
MDDELKQLKRRLSIREARDQAAEATGFLASIEIEVGDEVFEIPQRGLFDDEQRERMDALDLATESWDREPDIHIPERHIKDGEELVVFPAQTRPGPLKIPYRKTVGDKVELIKPSYPVQVAIALWGNAKYEKFKKAGGSATTVTATLAMLDKRLTDREKSRSESDNGDGPVEPSPNRTRIGSVT